MAKVGRPKGSTADLVNLGKIAARAHHERAIATLVKQLDSPIGATAVAAANSILDRAWGKPAQAHEITGANGGAIETCEVSARDVLLNRLAGLATRQDDSDKPSLN